MTRLPVELPDRFVMKTRSTPEGCVVWTAHLRNGYGRFNAGGRVVSAHRFAYEALVGPIPEGHHIHHECENPACVNVDHLRPATNAENVQIGRAAKLNAEAVAHIRRTGRELAERYGVSISRVSEIVRGVGWEGVR